MPPIDYPLKNYGFVTLDGGDLEMASSHPWMCIKHPRGKRYAAFDKWNGTKTVRTYMHRLLMGVQGSSYPLVDHIDGDGLNNCRSNLRLATHSMNTQNVKTKGRYRGVFKQGNGYVAKLGKAYAGFFESEVSAALAYDKLAFEMCGPAAQFNFPNNCGTQWLTNRFLCTL